jgi:hypothetical protein
MNHDSGFFTFAFGAKKYYELATFLALSLIDRGGRLSIVCDDPNYVPSNLFDRVVFFDRSLCISPKNPQRIDAGLAKLQLWQHLPYEKGNLFIDADSLVGSLFEPEICLVNFAGVDFTISYDPSSFTDFGPGVQWVPKNLVIDKKFKFKTPAAGASSVMYFQNEKRTDLHTSALQWYWYLQKKEGHRNYNWFASIPDELCYAIAYADVGSEPVGDKGYNKTLRQNADVKNLKDIEKGIKTYSSGSFRLSVMAKNNYETHAARLAKKYHVPFWGWKEKYQFQSQY